MTVIRLSQHALQSPHALACMWAGQRLPCNRAPVETVDARRVFFFGGGPSIIVPENRNARFFGGVPADSQWSRSRDGAQCLTRGVLSHTWKIARAIVGD